MQVLERLASAKLIELSVTDLVLQEHETKKFSDVTGRLQSVIDHFKEISKTLKRSGVVIPVLEEFPDKVRDLEVSVCDSLKRSTVDWIDRCSVTLINQDPKIYVQLWQDYFLGQGAFKKPKSRDDIPDAAIALSMLDYAGSSDLTVVCKDGQLKGYLGKLKNIAIYDDLEALIASAEIEGLLGTLDARNSKIEELKQAIASEAFKARLMEYICKEKSDLYYACWKEGDIENLHNLPVPLAAGISVDGPLVETIEEVSYGSVVCIDPQHFVLPISFMADVPVTFACNYGDWLQLSDSEKIEVEIDYINGEGVCEAHVIMRAKVFGQIVVVCLDSMSAEALMAHSNYIGVEGGRLDIEYVSTKLVL